MAKTVKIIKRYNKYFIDPKILPEDEFKWKIECSMEWMSDDLFYDLNEDNSEPSDFKDMIKCPWAYFGHI